MGWKLDLLLVILALAAIPFRGWVITIPVFLFLVVKSFLGGKRRGRPLEVTVWRGKKYFRRPPVKPALGLFLLILSFGSFMTGGVFAPISFAILGFALILWGPTSRSSLLARVTPVKESIVFRDSLIPFRLAAVAQVKPMTRDLGKALSAINERVLVIASERPSIFVEVHVPALSRKSAEAAVIERLRDLTAALVPIGAYLLPLDPEQVGRLANISFEEVRAGEESLLRSLTSTAYDAVSIEPRNGFVKSIGVYRRVNRGEGRKVALLTPRQTLKLAPALGDVFTSIEARVQWPSPDTCTAFLSSLFATRDEEVEGKITEAGSASDSRFVLVKSHATPPVEFSRAQLSALMSMYQRPS